MFLWIFVVLHLGQVVQTNSLCVDEHFTPVQQVYMRILRQTRDNSTIGCSVQCRLEPKCPAFTFSAENGLCTLFVDMNDGFAICYQQNVYLWSNGATLHNVRPIRLVGGPFYGRLEVYYGGWGTVCDDGFTNLNAKIVCKQLGLPSTNAVVKDSAYYGQGSGNIHLDDVQCVGHETYLSQCCHARWGDHNCNHAEDVGIICW